MSRLPLTDLDAQSDAIRDFAARRGNLNVFRLLANAPDVFAGWTKMVDELFDSPTFTLRMREVVILRVAHLQAARYELAQHTAVARSAGLTEHQIAAILGDGDLDDAAEFSIAERLVLDLVTELCTTRGLTGESFAAGQKALGDAAFTELLMLVSCYYGLALVLNAADVEVDTAARFQP